MKIKSFVCLFFACMLLTVLPALQSTLVIDDATPNLVQGTVTMYNDTTTPVEWIFGDTNWIDLFIDGNHTHFGGFTIMIGITIPAGETRIEHILYEGPPALTAGTHSAQACIRWGIDWAPITTQINFDLHSAFDNFNFAYQVQYAHPDSIAILLSITNSGTEEISYNFEDNWYHVVFDADDVPTTSTYAPGNLTLAPGEQFTTQISYYPSTPLALAHHLFMIFINNFGELPYVLLEVTPTDAHDAVSSPMPNISVHPNPFRQGTTLSFQKDEPGPIQIHIYNIRGQKVLSYNANAKSGMNEFSWNGRDHSGHLCAAGVYIVEWRDRATTQRSKCVKME